MWAAITKKKKVAVVDPFAQWDVSEDKVEVTVNWSMPEKDIMLGSIECDVDAPANVAREYCRRFLRDELNARCGERFLLMAKGEGLPIMEESRKRIGQLAPQRFNAASREIEHTLVLVENKEEGLEPLQIPVIKSEQLKRLEEEMEKKRLVSLLIDERKTKEVEMSDEKKDELKREMVLSGMAEKKVSKLFNRNGKLVSISYNDATRNLERERRKKFKMIVDECMGVDTQGEHNFLIEGQAPVAVEGQADETATEAGESKIDTAVVDGGEIKSASSLEQPSVSAAIENAWDKYFDDQGYEYYVNRQSGESQYEIPEGYAES